MLLFPPRLVVIQMIMSVFLWIDTLTYNPSVAQGQGASQTQALPSEGASSFLRLTPPHSFQSDRKQGGMAVSGVLRLFWGHNGVTVRECAPVVLGHSGVTVSVLQLWWCGCQWVVWTLLLLFRHRVSACTSGWPQALPLPPSASLVTYRRHAPPCPAWFVHFD